MSVDLSKKDNNAINAPTLTTEEDVEAPMAGEENSEPSVDHVPSLAVPSDYFIYVGSAETKGNSLYKCKKCPLNNKTVSCNDFLRHLNGSRQVTGC